MTQYLAARAKIHSVNTLKQRLSALGKWHTDQGFPDPTKTPLVRSVMKGIRELHHTRERQVKPFQLEGLQLVTEYLDSIADMAAVRNKALVLTGFWRAFRSDELVRIMMENVQFVPNEGMKIYLPRSKTYRDSVGREYLLPMLNSLCPVTAYQDWIVASKISSGPVFRGVDRWGNVSTVAMNAGSIIPLIRRIMKEAGMKDAEEYSSHSLRRGFATWASRSGFDIKMLMEWVGWKDPKSALKYIDTESHTKVIINRLLLQKSE